MNTLTHRTLTTLLTAIAFTAPVAAQHCVTLAGKEPSLRECLTNTCCSDDEKPWVVLSYRVEDAGIKYWGFSSHATEESASASKARSEEFQRGFASWLGTEVDMIYKGPYCRCPDQGGDAFTSARKSVSDLALYEMSRSLAGAAYQTVEYALEQRGMRVPELVKYARLLYSAKHRVDRINGLLAAHTTETLALIDREIAALDRELTAAASAHGGLPPALRRSIPGPPSGGLGPTSGSEDTTPGLYAHVPRRLTDFDPADPEGVSRSIERLVRQFNLNRRADDQSHGVWLTVNGRLISQIAYDHGTKQGYEVRYAVADNGRIQPYDIIYNEGGSMVFLMKMTFPSSSDIKHGRKPVPENEGLIIGSARCYTPEKKATGVSFHGGSGALHIATNRNGVLHGPSARFHDARKRKLDWEFTRVTNHWTDGRGSGDSKPVRMSFKELPPLTRAFFSDNGNWFRSYSGVWIPNQSDVEQLRRGLDVARLSQ